MSISPHKILVAEDNAALSRVLEFTLSKAGYEVLTAIDGSVAWKIAQQQPIDIVLTDQQMPMMTGTELCSRLRDSEQYADTPVILLTATDMEMELPYLCEELDICATFSKPFIPSQVLKTVQEILARKSGTIN